MSDDYVRADVFTAHAKNEEINQKITNDALHEGNIRMGNIEGELKELATDLKPLLKLYHAVMGATTLDAFFVGLLIFIYSNDRESIKKIGEAVQTQGMALEKLIQKHEVFETDTTKEISRIERVLEKMERK